MVLPLAFGAGSDGRTPCPFARVFFLIPNTGLTGITLPPVYPWPLVFLPVFLPEHSQHSTLLRSSHESWIQAIDPPYGWKFYRFMSTHPHARPERLDHQICTVTGTLQVVGLLILAYYTCSSPTWTQSLNAYALARIGALLAPQMKAEGIEGLREHPRPEDVQKALVGMSGVVGIVSHDCETGNNIASHMLLMESTATVNEDGLSTEGTTTVQRRVIG